MSEGKPIATASGNTPPAYTKDPENPAPPPSYDTVVARVKSAKKDSSGPVDFFLKFFAIVFGTIGFLIFVVLMLALPVAMIVVGARNLDNCSGQRYIPIWLVVSGSVCAFMQLVYIGKALKNRGDERRDEEEVNKSYGCFNCLLSTFNLAWFIAGNVWVFSIYQPATSNMASPRYCHGPTYYLAFWVIIATYIWAALTCCCGCCLGLWACSAVASNSEDDKPAAGTQ